MSDIEPYLGSFESLVCENGIKITHEYLSDTIDSEGIKRTMAVCELLSKRCRETIERIAKNEGFTNYEIAVAPGSTLGENYLGEIFKIVVTGNRGSHETESLRLILKVSLKLPQLREEGFIQGVYQREAYAYTKLLPILDEFQKDLPADEKFKFVKLYEAVLEEDEEFLVMEDIGVRGYDMMNRMISFNYDELVVCIKTLARFHAASFVLKAKQPDVYNEIYKTTYNYETMKDGFLKYLVSCKQPVRAIIENEPYEKEIEGVFQNMEDDFRHTFDNEITNPYSVFIHGDSWTNNLLFKSKDGKADSMIILDWQLMRNASPVLDLSYVLLLSTDGPTRSKHYNEMLDLYYQVLSSNITKMGVDISECYPSSIYRKQVAEYMKFGLIVAFGLLQMTLSNKEDALDHVELFENFGEDDIPCKLPISKTCVKRMKELFQDCITFNVI